MYVCTYVFSQKNAYMQSFSGCVCMEMLNYFSSGFWKLFSNEQCYLYTSKHFLCYEFLRNCWCLQHVRILHWTNNSVCIDSLTVFVELFVLVSLLYSLVHTLSIRHQSRPLLHYIWMNSACVYCTFPFFMVRMRVRDSFWRMTWLIIYIVPHETWKELIRNTCSLWTDLWAFVLIRNHSC